MQNLKSKIKIACLDFIDKQIKEIEVFIDGIVEAKNNETKSTAGDKYETARAMMQIEEAKAQKQHQQLVEQKNTLLGIDMDKKYQFVNLGACVNTSIGIFFIATGIGKLMVDGINYFVISKESPIGEKLMGKQVGDTFIFNNKEIKILDVV